MPKTKKVPAYRLQKSRNLAVVRINGHDHYLGEYGSVESREAYGRLIAQHASGVEATPQPTAKAGFSINEIVLAFIQHARTHYRKNGKVTDEFGCFQSAVRPLVDLYGFTPAVAYDNERNFVGFDAPKLRAVRDKMIELKWSRKYINKCCGRIRTVFRFALSNGLLGSPIEGAAVITSLESLAPLLEGRSNAIELPPRSAVPAEHIAAVKAKVNQRTRDMIDLCLLTGARPGELVMLTTRMIDMTHGDVWTAQLVDHKMKHKGKQRVLAFGPQAKAILKRYLRTALDAPLFNIRRDTFSKSIVYWCTKLKIPRFTGHWLRHNAGTEIRSREDLDAAQVLLGHSDQKTTQIYAHTIDASLIAVARKHG